MLSMCARGGKDQGLLRWMTSPSFGTGEGRPENSCLTAFLGEIKTAVRLGIKPVWSLVTWPGRRDTTLGLSFFLTPFPLYSLRLAEKPQSSGCPLESHVFGKSLGTHTKLNVLICLLLV